MNKSRASNISDYFLIMLVSGIVGLSVSSESLALTVQGSRFSETPDPYFNLQQTTDAKAKSFTKTTQSEFVAPNLTPPTVIPVKQEPVSNAQQPDIWKTPLTPVLIPKPPTAEPPLATSKPANSIIRENKPFADSNAFSKTPMDSSRFSPIASGSALTDDAKNQFGSNGFRPTGSSLPQSPDLKLAGPGLHAPLEDNPLNEKAVLQAPLSLGTADPGDDRVLGGPLGNAMSSNVLPAPASTKVDSSARKTEAFEPSKVIALVGGEPIFVGDLLFEINQILEQFMPQASEEVKERERQKMIPKLLPRFVEQKILFLGSIRQLPPEADIEAVLEQAGKEFDDKALNAIMENSGIKSTAEFDAHLRVQGSSLRKLRRSWSVEQLTKYFLSQQLQISTEVTHQEMLESYRENHDSYAVPARSRWEQVMIRFDRSSSRAEAKKTLVELGNQIVYGANLAAVAEKSSHGFRADQGGQHDWTTRGALVLKEIDEAIFTLPIGELSDIIETRDGFHVVRVIERTEATHKPFLEAQVEIKERILAEKKEKAYKKHVAKLKKEIPVEYLQNDYAEEAIKQDVAKTAQR